jgi:hypothetical protein
MGVLLLAVASEVVLRLAMPHWREFFSGWFMQVVAVPDHGAVITGRPGFDGYFAQNNGDFRVRIRVNEFGLRNPEPVDKAGGRVWIVGDSMAFGWGVEQDEMYSSVIATLLGMPTYNVASPGTDVCGYQALVARMPSEVRPKAVIVGLILENDILSYDCRKEAKRVAQTQANSAAGPDAGFRQFVIKHTALYNFLAVSLKRVAPVRDALTALGLIAEGHVYRRLLDDAEAGRAVERTADELTALKAMLPARTPMAVLIAPARFEIRDGDAYYRRLRLATAAALAGRGIAVIDPFEEFRRVGFVATHFAHDGHWSPLGHRLAAAAVAAWLKGQGIGG